MTNNLDQFDQSPDFDETGDGERKAGFASNVSNAWRTKPVFKLVVLLVAVAAVIALVINLTTAKPETEISHIAPAANLNEAPGGKASPAFIEAQAEANKQRIEEAAAVGGTALPTPLPSGISMESRKEDDPLVEFRAEMQRQKEEQQRQIQALQQQSQRQQNVTIQQDQQMQEKMGQGMQAQMSQLAELWKPKTMQVITGEGRDGGGSSRAEAGGASQTGAGGVGSTAPNSQGGSAANSAPTKKGKPLILAGTINYAQLLTEANSDVPGPILAQIVSGPLSGARAIGKFSVANDLMALSFEKAARKGKEYDIKAIALDPETTLGGMASEVDHRYFARVVLPAAAAFISAFGQKLAEKPTDTIVTSGGTVITNQAESGIEDGLYAGMGSAGQTIAQFFANEGSNTKVLVRIAVGTPMGLFFVDSVCAGESPCGDDEPEAAAARPVLPRPTSAPTSVAVR